MGPLQHVKYLGIWDGGIWIGNWVWDLEMGNDGIYEYNGVSCNGQHGFHHLAKIK